MLNIKLVIKGSKYRFINTTPYTEDIVEPLLPSFPKEQRENLSISNSETEGKFIEYYVSNKTSSSS